MQLRKVHEEKDRQQIILLELLTKRARIRDILQEVSEDYQKKQRQNGKEDDLKKAELYLMLVKERVRKE